MIWAFQRWSTPLRGAVQSTLGDPHHTPKFLVVQVRRSMPGLAAGLHENDAMMNTGIQLPFPL